MSSKNLIKGTVTSRICSKCGHHEIGIITSEGEFIPLRPGMQVQVIEEIPVKENGAGSEIEPEQKIKDSDVELRPWLPYEFRKNKNLRLKYGVLIKKNEEILDEEGYKKAFIRKIQSLIEKENFPQLAVILDKFYQSPHLAAGNSAEITLNLIRDIDEIRRPIILMGKWLNDKNKENFSKLLEPFTEKDLVDEVPSDKDLLKELLSLTLEDFFKLLT